MQWAPHVLRRLAEIADAFDTLGLHTRQGEILACRRCPEGYRTVAYYAPDLMITLSIANGEAHLTWRAGDASDDRHITLETSEAVIDAILLEAVSAVVNARLVETPA